MSNFDHFCEIFEKYIYSFLPFLDRKNGKPVKTVKKGGKTVNGDIPGTYTFNIGTQI